MTANGPADAIWKRGTLRDSRSVPTAFPQLPYRGRMLCRTAVFIATSLAMVSAAPAAQTRTVLLYSLHGFHERGMATVSQRGHDVVVRITMTGMPAEAPPEFAHIHTGTCAHLGTRAPYELEPIRDGRSTTVLKNLDMSTLTRGSYAIAIHQTLAHVSLHIACAGPI